MTAPNTGLHDVSGRLVLVGAGKMGGALLEGWLGLGLPPDNIVVLEPQPSPQIADFAARGIALNPPLQTLTDVAAIVIALKPQIAADMLSRSRPAGLAIHRGRVDHGGAHAALSSGDL